MNVIRTKLEGCFIIEPTVFEDDRGWFFESFNQDRFTTLTGIETEFVQDNHSNSSYGVLRGLHFQKGEHAQAKLVRVISGEVLDVAIDIRKGSDTYGQHLSVKLSADNKKQLFVPRGFAHGFVVLSESCELLYKCDNNYHKQAEGGILFNDSDLNIDWIVPVEKIKISEKDSFLPSFNTL